jgi:hypothetical protein
MEGERRKNSEEKAEDKQRNKMQRLNRQYE